MLMGLAQITPSEKLEWHPCFGDTFRCARLTVPMDYHRPLNESAEHPKVHLALMLLPSQKGNASGGGDPASYGESPLLVNPGGPGGSGTGFMQITGSMFQDVVGRHRDVIGFDPRGVGATTPPTDCFAVPEERRRDGADVSMINRLTWLISGHDVGLVNSSDVALGKIDVRARALAKLCKKADDLHGENSIFRYANTANVARDMLSIVDAWDEWRSASQDGKTELPKEPAADAPSAQHEAPGGDPVRNLSTKGKLVYWGFSYGSLLGATFAAMFPDRVGRVVLDGVVDADHYVEPTWVDSLVDADAIWEAFFTGCHEAGYKCKFYRDGDSIDDLRERFYALMDQLQERPAIVIPSAPAANFPILITASDIKVAVFASLYAPNAAFAQIALLLDLILENGMSPWAGAPVLPHFCHGTSSISLFNEAQAAIMCSDKRYKVKCPVPMSGSRGEE